MATTEGSFNLRMRSTCSSAPEQTSGTARLDGTGPRRPHEQVAAALAPQPCPPDQVGVGMAHRVVMDLQPPRQLPDARHGRAGFQLLGGDKRDDLFRHLVAKRDFALL